MKRNPLSVVLLLVLIVILGSCEDRRFQTLTANVPVYISWDELRSSYGFDASRTIEKPGKIYFTDQVIDINECLEGVHLVDISDPGDPQKIGFINAPGNIDIAIKDSVLFLDSYTDLLLVDISDPRSPEKIKRVEDVFEYTLPEYDMDYPLATIEEEKGVVTGWEVKRHTQEIQQQPVIWPFYEHRLDASSLMSSVQPGGGSAYGVAGSMARFLTHEEYLFVLDQESRLKVLEISDINNPRIVTEKHVGWGLETLFIQNTYLYVGSRQGLYILDISDPGQPHQTSMYRHITSCDPVVVQGNIAYVTLRSGNRCGGTEDLLEIIDISDKYNPEKIASYGKKEPYGLGVKGQLLFVCEGKHGLGIYDASDLNHIKENRIALFGEIEATDVIPMDTLLFTIGDSGFYIYDFSDVQEIFLLSKIEVDRSEPV